MADTKSITIQVLESIQRNPSGEFAALVADCSEFTWNQLFNEVDRLSRMGQVCLIPVGNGPYFLRLSQSEKPHEINTVSGTCTARVSLPDPNVPPGQGHDQASLNDSRSAHMTTIADQHSSIAERAYQLYEAQGHEQGHALEHWLKAEQEIRGYGEPPVSFSGGAIIEGEQHEHTYT